MAKIRVKRAQTLENPTLQSGELGLIGNDLYFGRYENGNEGSSATKLANQNASNLFIATNTFKPVEDTTDAVLFQDKLGNTFYKALAGRLVVTHPAGFSFNQNDLVDRAYVDGRTQGLAIKTAVLIASKVEFPSTYNAVGKTLTATSTGLLDLIFDGTNPDVDARVLVKNQANDIYNGIYTVTTAGAVGVAAVLTRAEDANLTEELVNAYVFVNGGSTLEDTGWYCDILSTTNIDTGAIPWSQFSSAGTYIADETTLTKVGNTFGLQEMSSATFAGKITDETGSGSLVFATSPTFTTSINSAAGSTMGVFNSSAVINAFIDAATLKLGYDDTGSSTTNINTNAVGDLETKSINIGTGGIHTGSTTTISIGTSSGGGFSTSINNVLQTNNTADTDGTFYRQDTTAAPTKTTKLKYSGHLYATKFFGPLGGNADSATTLSATLAATLGGTGLASYAAGDILYASATNTLSALTKSTNGKVLTLTSGFPTWETPSVSLTDNVLDGSSNIYSPYTAAAAGKLYTLAVQDNDSYTSFTDRLYFGGHFDAIIDGGAWTQPA